LTTLTTPAKGIICSDFITVNTGSPLAAALMAHELHGLLEPYVVEFHKQLGRH
jgi:hypothetical protein